jgi:hypothetical protein
MLVYTVARVLDDEPLNTDDNPGQNTTQTSSFLTKITINVYLFLTEGDSLK